MPKPSVEIVGYDPAWAELAVLAIRDIRVAVHPMLVEIEHIGSTAVPGLAAKPTIDIMGAANDLRDVRACDRDLAALGYHPHVNGMSERLLYVRSSGHRRTHILHVVTMDSWPTRNQRILRDHLRSNPQDAARYAALKYAVAADAMSVAEYTRAKTDLIQEMTDRARAERGLPSVPVWEK